MHDENLEELADQFLNWAAEERLLVSRAMAAVVRSHPIRSKREDRDGREDRPDPHIGLLARELGHALPAFRNIFRDDPIHFVGTSPKPKALILGHSRKHSSPGPRKTSSGIEIQYAAGKAPDVRVASTPIKPASTLVGAEGPYPCGASISLGNVIGAGTMAALVEDGEGRLLGLTCNHVTGMCNHTERGTQVVAPALLDVTAGSLDPFTLGHHHNLLELAIGTPENVDISGNIDAALFRVLDAARVSSMQQNFFDTPTTSHKFAGQIVVEKVGRTTGLTKGWLAGPSRRNLPTGIDIGPIKGTIYYNNMLLVLSTDGTFADRGDSGALVVTERKNGEREAVGIVFAISPDRSKTYVAPIHDMLARLRVTLKGGHNAARIQGAAVP